MSKSSKKINHYSSNKSAKTTVSKSELYAGIIPKAEEFEKYESVYPGAAKIILDHATKQIEARHEQTNRVISIEEFKVHKDKNFQTLGLWFSFLIILILLGLSGFMILKDKEVWGGSFFLIDILWVVALFIRGNNNQRKD